MQSISHILWLSLIVLLLVEPESGQAQLFDTKETIGELHYTHEAIPADLDMDGDADILLIAGITENIVLFENLGEGSFHLGDTISTIDLGALEFVTGDFDGDGDLDLVRTAPDFEAIYLAENTGSLTFSSYTILTGGIENPKYLKAGDLDDDGDLDLAFVAKLKQPMWLENLGSAWVSHTIGDSTDGITTINQISDLNSDGLNDIVSSSFESDKLGWYANTGAGTFGPLQLLADEMGCACIVEAADLNGDGALDLLAMGRGKDSLLWFEGFGGGTFFSEQVIDDDILYGPTGIAVGDLNADGTADILLTRSSELRWYKNLGSGSFGPAQMIDNPVGVSKPFAVDLDGDSDLDVVTIEDVNLPTDFTGEVVWRENLSISTGIPPSEPLGSPETFVANDAVHVQSSTPFEQVTIFDVLGRVLVYETGHWNESAFKIAHHAAGIFFIQIKIGGQTYIEKFFLK